MMLTAGGQLMSRYYGLWFRLNVRSRAWLAHLDLQIEIS